MVKTTLKHTEVLRAAVRRGELRVLYLPCPRVYIAPMMLRRAAKPVLWMLIGTALFAALSLGYVLTLPNGERVIASLLAPLEQQLRDAGALYAERDAALQSKLVQQIASIPQTDGQRRRKVIQDFLQNRTQAFEATLGNPLVKRADKQPLSKENLATYYHDKYQSVDMPEVNGEPDFKAYNAERSKILSEATAAGLPAHDVTFRKPLADPKAEAIVAEYKKAQETLRPYWELTEKVIAAMGPAVQQAVKDVKSGARTRAQAPLYKIYDEAVTRERQQMRVKNRDTIEQALIDWYGYKKLDLSSSNGGKIQYVPTIQYAR